ncbi:2Fe-2S iron-sulfur cluster-binding protein [Rhodococcoides fascians]|uniref:2Fe-2S iron-sulfur cluster-binding protein n=1 Tax=Rhodococcoides fascians TaxID=1828 RepID=UPI00056CC7CC|nr:2Fe-2S iron-sulfur cluster-binding protein [Rhodococcus fascians]
MSQITFALHDGSSTVLEADSGDTVMQTAVRNGLSAIVAECGGVLSCATCHVFVAPENSDDFAPASEAEEAMLEGTAEDREPTSRLSCQLVVPDGVDEIRVRVPEFQD